MHDWLQCSMFFFSLRMWITGRWGQSSTLLHLSIHRSQRQCAGWLEVACMFRPVVMLMGSCTNSCSMREMWGWAFVPFDTTASLETVTKRKQCTAIIREWPCFSFLLLNYIFPLRTTFIWLHLQYVFTYQLPVRSCIINVTNTEKADHSIENNSWLQLQIFLSNPFIHKMGENSKKMYNFP